MLEKMILRETEFSVELINGIVVEVRSANPAWVRGSTIVLACIDETAFLPTEDSAQPDTELLNADPPGDGDDSEFLADLLQHAACSTRRIVQSRARAHFGSDESSVAFFNASTLVANPSLDPKIIDQAFADDPVVAASEFGTDGFVSFRSDVESFLSNEILQAIVNPDLPLISEAA